MDHRSTSPTPPEPWGELALPQAQTVTRTVGPLSLHFVRTEGEIRVATGDRDPQALAPADWSRWTVPESADKVRLLPALPDRPLVLEPEMPFVLLPGTEARVYVRVPLVARLELDLDGAPHVLAEHPAIELSDTWWGDVEEGEIAYWLHTSARRTVAPELLTSHQAICPLQLVNRSPDELRVERLTLRVAHLSIFAGRETGGLWTDVSRVRYMGEDEGSQIDNSGAPPDEAEGGQLVTRPREPLTRGLRARTFARLRALPGVTGGGP